MIKIIKMMMIDQALLIIIFLKIFIIGTKKDSSRNNGDVINANEDYEKFGINQKMVIMELVLRTMVKMMIKYNWVLMI